MTTFSTPWQPPLSGPVSADVVVVGAGVSGLVSAYHLRRLLPDAKIVVLEATTVGGGASGHGTGLARPGVWGTLAALRGFYGPEAAHALVRASVAGLSALRDLVTSEGIDCGFASGHMYQFAVNRAHAARLAADVAGLSELGMRVEWLEPGQAPVPGPFGATRVEPLHMVDPLRLCRGLRDLLAQRDVECWERSPVREVRPGPPVTLRTDHAVVTASQVVLAIDGYTKWSGLVRLPVIPMRSQAVCTEPLSVDQRAALGWRLGDLLLDSRYFFNYLRLSPDHRLIFGGGRATNPVTPPGEQPAVPSGTWRRIERELRRLFPALGEVRVAGAWSGVTGTTPDFSPIVGAPPGMPGVWFMGGWNGRGIAPSCHAAPWLAGQVAAALHGRPAPAAQLPWHRGTAPTRPLGRLRYPLRQFGMDLLDRGALAAGRRESR